MCVWVDRRCKTDLTVHLHANLVSPLGGRQKRKSDRTWVAEAGVDLRVPCALIYSKPQLQATHLQYGVREEAWRTGGRGGAEEAGEEEDFELQLQLALRAAEEAAIAEEDAVLAAEEAELSAEEAKYAAEQARLNAIAARQRLRQHSHEQLRQHSHEQHAAPGRRRLWSDLVGDPEVPSTVEIPPRGLPPPALLPLPTGKHALPMPLQRRGLPAPTWKRLREAQRASVQWEMDLSSDRCELPPTGAALAATAAAAAAEAKVAAAATTARTAEDDVLDRELAALEAEEAELDRLEALEAALEVTLEAAKTKHWLLQHVPPPNVITNVTPLQLLLPPRPHATTQLQPHRPSLQPGAPYMYVPANPLLQAQEPLPPLPPHPQIVVGRPILGTTVVPPATATSKKWFRMRAWFGGGDASMRNVVNV